MKPSRIVRMWSSLPLGRPALPVALVAVTASLAAASLFACGSGASSSKGGAPPVSEAGASLPLAVDPAWLTAQGARQPGLPKAVAVTTQDFKTSESCHQCHLKYQGPDGDACVDAKGNDVSPTALGGPTIEALAARDPFFLAAFSREREGRTPDAQATVDTGCSPCHAPAAVVEAPLIGGAVTFASLTAGTQPLDTLARDGISCSLCHQIPPDGLGTDQTFGGKISIGADHLIYGPHQNPNPAPMQFFVSYTPSYSLHMMTSELCATCHVVRTPLIDAAGKPTGKWFLEQGTYFEWQSSDYPGKGTTCQSCHMPRTDDDGAEIETRLAHPPAVSVNPRKPFGRHTAPGGNSYVLRLIEDNADWVGTTAAPADLETQAKRTDAQLAKAIQLDVTSATRAPGFANVVVHLANKSGHKFPTGYPSRRAWLHVAARGADGAVFWESGRPDAFGRIVTRDNRMVDRAGTFEPHHDVVDDEAKVQIYEGVAQDENGVIVTRLLDAASYGKDNRLLPAGFSFASTNAQLTAPYGTSFDSNFGAEDLVTYRIAAPDGAVTVDVELLYESVSPRAFDALLAAPTDTSRAFFDMAKRRPPVPVRVAAATAQL